MVDALLLALATTTDHSQEPACMPALDAKLFWSTMSISIDHGPTSQYPP